MRAYGVQGASKGSEARWIVCQIGAREHYAVARALYGEGWLEMLVTDAWVPPYHPLALFAGGLNERFHSDMAQARVAAANLGIVAFDAVRRLSRESGWPGTVARNAWFQKMAIERLARVPDDGRPRVVFAYSYAANEIFKLAQARRWRTVLGQIDGGPAEERIVAGLHAQQPENAYKWEPAPSGYWEAWREECALADYIVTNSQWSCTALQEEDIRTEKLAVVPLAYEAPAEATGFARAYPICFTDELPLRVLFLGQINLRKGVLPLFEAIRLLRDEPVEFWFVGTPQLPIPADLERSRTVRWFGAVPRRETWRFYRDADVFIFPTFSDGFGLTQLEAQAWKLPVIASRHCGEVVVDGESGLVLPSVTAPEICCAIRKVIADPQLLQKFADHALSPVQFGLQSFQKALMRAVMT